MEWCWTGEEGEGDEEDDDEDDEDVVGIEEEVKEQVEGNEKGEGEIQVEVEGIEVEDGKFISNFFGKCDFDFNFNTAAWEELEDRKPR